MKRFFLLLLLLPLLTACARSAVAGASTPAVWAVSPADGDATPTPFQPVLFTPTLPPTRTPSPSPSPTDTPVPTLTPTWVYNEPGQVVAPILLYHRVEGTTTDSRYSVPVPVFRAQMQALHDWGYTAIPISLLLDALTEGAPLPEKPVVITFDDGNLNIYENAFPIMQEYGYPGVFYIIARNINVGTNVVHVPELEEMIAAGWEVGSHSYNHPDLAANHALIPYEVGQSKSDLEAALGVEIQTFAYPYGTIDPYLESQVRRYGYRGGMGLGTSWTHTLETLFYLSRIEVYSSYTMDDFAARLPWKPR